jgi:hypothetical protein
VKIPAVVQYKSPIRSQLFLIVKEGSKFIYGLTFGTKGLVKLPKSEAEYMSVLADAPSYMAKRLLNSHMSRQAILTKAARAFCQKLI